MTSLTEIFNQRLSIAKSLIRDSGIQFIEAGVFGSYARNEYNGLSDIDIVLIVEELPDVVQKVMLRGKLEDIKCDLAILRKTTFDCPNSLFSRAVVRDYRRIL